MSPSHVSNEEARIWTRSTRWASYGVFATGLGIVSLVAPSPILKWVFSPYLLVVGAILFTLDLRAYPQHAGAGVLTAKYWTGRPIPWVWRGLLALVLGYLLILAVLTLLLHAHPGPRERAMPPQIAWLILACALLYPIWYAVLKIGLLRMTGHKH